MGTAAARGVDDASRAHVVPLLARVRGVAKGCDASTLAQDGVSVDLLGLAEHLGGLHVLGVTPRGVPDLAGLTPTALNKIRESINRSRCVRLLVVAKLVSNFIANHLSENEIDTTKFRNTSAREDEAGSLEYQASNTRTSRANAPLAQTRLSRGSPRVGTTLLLIRGTMLSEAGLLPLEAGATPRSAPRGQRRGGFEGPES